MHDLQRTEEEQRLRVRVWVATMLHIIQSFGSNSHFANQSCYITNRSMHNRATRLIVFIPSLHIVYYFNRTIKMKMKGTEVPNPRRSSACDSGMRMLR